jgi:hypothetical protein
MHGRDCQQIRLIFQTREVIRASGLSALKTAGKPADLLRETKERMFAA